MPFPYCREERPDSGSDTEAYGYIAMDSADGEFATIYGIQWKTCDE